MGSQRGYNPSDSMYLAASGFFYFFKKIFEIFVRFPFQPPSVCSVKADTAKKEILIGVTNMKKTTSKFTIAALAAALVLGGGYASVNQFDASAETPSVVAAEGDAVVADAAPAEDAEAITTTTTSAQAEDITTTTTTVAVTTEPATTTAATTTQAVVTTQAATTTKAATTTAKTTTKAATTSAKTTSKNGSPKTGDAFPALGLTAVIGAAGLVGLATRKKDS